MTDADAARRVRVGLLVDNPDPEIVASGQHRVIWQLVTGLDRDRFEPVLVTTGDTRFRRVVDETGCRTVVRSVQEAAFRRTGRWIGGRSVADPLAMLDNALKSGRTVRGWADLIRRERFDVVYLPSYALHFTGGAAARLCGCGSVAHAQGLAQATRRLPLLVPAHRVWCAACGCRLVAISQAVARSLGTIGVDVVPNGIETERFRPVRALRAAARDDDPNRAPIVGWISRLNYTKRMHLLPRAVARIAARFPAARHVVIGGEADPALMRQVGEDLATGGLSDRVTFLGERDDLPERMREIDVVGHLCAVEGFGLAIGEAMAAGLPVVAFASGGIPEVIEHGRSGILVADPGDVEALGDAIAGLLCSPDRARILGEAGAERVDREFSVGRFVERFSTLFEQEAARTPRPR